MAVVVFAVALVAGCTPSGDLASISPTSTSTTMAPTTSLPPPPSASPMPTSGIPNNAGPLTVPGELAFGNSDFGGLPYGQTASVYGANLSSAVHESACGDIDTSPMLFANNPSTPPWGLFLITNWNDPGVATGSATVEAFLLVVQSETLPTTQIGPVGPRGLRLGTPRETIEAMFPAEAAVTTQRMTTVIDSATDTEINITERVFSIADVDGGPMIITTVGDQVATIMWGNPNYVYVQRGTLRCTT